MNITLKLPKAVREFFMETGNLITFNASTHVYMSYPGFKIDVGSDELEIMSDRQEDLNLSLHGSPRKGSIAVCSQGHIGLITSDIMIAIVYPDETKGIAWTGIHLKGKIGTPWSSRNPTVVGHIDEMV